MSREAVEKDMVDLKKYIPFLQRMITSLSEVEDGEKLAQKQKFESLLSVISSSDTRLKPETQERCGEVLRKLYGKFGKDYDLGAKVSNSGEVQMNNARGAVYLNIKFGRGKDGFTGLPHEGFHPHIQGPAYDLKEVVTRPSYARDNVVRGICYKDAHELSGRMSCEESISGRSVVLEKFKLSEEHRSEAFREAFREDTCWQGDILSFTDASNCELQQLTGMECRADTGVRKGGNFPPSLSTASPIDWGGRSPSTIAQQSPRVHLNARTYDNQVQRRTPNPLSEPGVSGLHTQTRFQVTSRPDNHTGSTGRYHPYPLVDYRHGVHPSSCTERRHQFCKTESRPKLNLNKSESEGMQEAFLTKSLQFRDDDQSKEDSQGLFSVQAADYSSRTPQREKFSSNPSAATNQRFTNAVSIRPFLINHKPSLEQPIMHNGKSNAPAVWHPPNTPVVNRSGVNSMPKRGLDPRLERRNFLATQINSKTLGNTTATCSSEANIQQETTNGVVSRKLDGTSESFRSPLVSLYSDSASLQTGVGYGPQSFKKKNLALGIKKSDGTNVICNFAVDDSVVMQKSTVEVPITSKYEEPPSKETESSTVHRDQVVPLDVIETYLKKVLPLEEAQKVVDRVRCLEESRTEASGIKVGNVDETCTVECQRVATEQPNPTDAPICEAACSNVPKTASPGTSVQQNNARNKISAEGSSSVDTCEVPEVFRRKGAKNSGKKNSVPLFEVQRLYEESSKFLKGVELFDGRRPRRNASKSDGSTSKASTPQKGKLQQLELKTNSLVPKDKQIPAASNPTKDASGIGEETKKVSTFETVRNENCPVVRIHVCDDYFSTEEQTTSNRLEAVEGSVNVSASILSESSATSSELSGNLLVQTQTPSKAQGKRKHKSFHPTCSSLPEERSVHDASSEVSNVIETPDLRVEHFRCGECTFVGHKIVEHYVNNHPGRSIPYALLPQEKWDILKNLSLGPPSRYKHNMDLREECDWIPVGPTYLVPLACKLCSFTSSLRSELHEHFLLHGFDQSCKYRCLICPAEEESFFEMYDHVTLHTGEYRYKCGYCNHREARLFEIKNHMGKFHSLQDQLLFSTESMDSHTFWFYAFVCCNCRYIQLSEESLIAHVSSQSRCQSYCQVNVFELVFPSEVADSTPTPDAVESFQDGQLACLVERYLELRTWCFDRAWEKHFGSRLLGKLKSVEIKEESACVFQSRITRYRRQEPKNWVPALVYEFPAPNLDTVPFGQSFQKLLEGTVEKLRERDYRACSVSSGWENEETPATTTGIILEDFTEEGDMFLKVADVVSLHPFQEEERQTQPNSEENDSGCQSFEAMSLYPAFNMVVLLKEECTFPFRIPHNRITFAEEKKDSQIYSVMMMVENVTKFFKCMSFNCCFSSDCRLTFGSHLKDHEKHYCQTVVQPSEDENAGSEIVTVPDFHLCSYCPFVGRSVQDLILHLESSHYVHYSYQCSACFFRGASALHVEFHVLRDHSDKQEVSILPCVNIYELDNRIRNEVSEPSHLLRYFCSVGHCNLSFVTHSAFRCHVTLAHPGTDYVSCNYCDRITNLEELFDHSVVHGLGAFQCLYCAYGTNSLESILNHVSLAHADQAVKVYWRSEGCLKPTAPFASQRSQRIPVEEALSRIFASAEFILPNSSADQSGLPPSADVWNYMEANVEDGRTDAFEPASTLAVVSTSSSTSACRVLCTSLSSGSNVAGLAGHDLYICGNIGCRFSAPDAAELKEHLCVCDLARDSELLACYHCLKPQKSISHLIDHLKTHGLKPYSCGLCGKCFESFGRATWHVKKAHHSPGSCVSLVSSKTPGSRFAVFPKAALKTIDDLESLEGLAAEKTSFRSGELANVPSREVSDVDLCCAECNFSTKVRSNLIRHLKLHQGDSVKPELLPDTCPVNPVPRLRHGNKLFSNTDYRPASVQDIGSTSDGQSDVQKSLPLVAFIPASKRYICGVAGCLFIGSNEDQLMCHVLNHKGELFDCPHCPSERKSLKLAEFLFHLKLHGPNVYGCTYCPFLHWKRSTTEQHMDGSHPGLNSLDLVIREVEDDASQSMDKAQEGERWKCTLCRHVLDRMSEAAAHVLNQHGVGEQFRCALCPERFSSKDAVLEHYGSAHPAGQKEVLVLFHRSFCKRPSSDNLNEQGPLRKRRKDIPRWIRGIAVAEEMEDMPQKLAEDAYSEVEATTPVNSDDTANPVDLPITQAAEKNVNMYGPVGTPMGSMFCCPLCSKYRTPKDKSYSFRMHLYLELDYKRFECSLCSKKYSNRSVARHIKDAHKDQQAEIIQLPKDLNIESWVENVIQAQMKMIKQASEPDQTKTCDSSSPATKNKPVTPSTYVRFSCNMCNFGCARESEVIAHRTSHPDQQLTYRTEFLPASDVQMGYETSIKYACPLCPDQFSTWHSVEEHLKQHPDVLQCGACHHLSATPEGIVSHWKNHHGDDKKCASAPIGSKFLDYISVMTVRLPPVKSSDSCSEGIRKGRSHLVTKVKEKAPVLTGKAGRHDSSESHVSGTEVCGKSSTDDSRQSTKKLPASSASCREGFSFYGKKPATVDLKKIFTVVDFNDSGIRRVNVESLAKKMRLFPVVKLHDCSN